MVLTSLIFPAPESTGLALEVVGGQAQLERAVLYPLKSIWQLTD